jgi:thiol-disulfide isomerase/thioredoxin
MRRFLGSMIAVLLGLLLNWTALAATLLPYHLGDWTRWKAQYKGQVRVVHFWGVTCGPCIEELPQWGEFVQKHPDLSVVFVQVDQTPERMTQRLIADAHLGAYEHHVSVGSFDDYTRYEIDPKWAGELPATFLIDRSGRVTHLSGGVDFGKVHAWVVNQSR